jgi:hypothetical protein
VKLAGASFRRVQVALKWASEHPRGPSLTSRLAEAFAEAADEELEPERKGFLRRGAEFFGGVGKDVTSEVIAKAIAQGM